jgi:hypothetical protein
VNRHTENAVPKNEPGITPSAEEREKIMEMALKNLILIDGKLFGLEDESEPDAYIDCGEKTGTCRANCCTYLFALTHEEAMTNMYRYNPDKPYYMARDSDGYCPYLDRRTLKCTIHDRRPIRCRKYTCSPK